MTPSRRLSTSSTRGTLGWRFTDERRYRGTDSLNRLVPAWDLFNVLTRGKVPRPPASLSLPSPLCSHLLSLAVGYVEDDRYLPRVMESDRDCCAFTLRYLLS